MILPLILSTALAAGDTPPPSPPPPEPAPVALPDCATQAPEIIAPLGSSPAAHAQARTASAIVLATAQKEAVESDSADDAEPGEQEAEAPSNR